jgi:hypothetical protein
MDRTRDVQLNWASIENKQQSRLPRPFLNTSIAPNFTVLPSFDS